jgi:cell division protein FtsI (penicillin-binding protein 3)
VPEIFIYSSNIGAARMALDVGIEGHQAFLAKLGLLDRLQTELPESARPLVPDPWRLVSSMTISFGHGLGVTPLQAAAAGAALVNGGKLITPTFLPRTAEEASIVARQVLRPETSRQMRYLMRLNVLKGTARRAEVKGYRVGGKTGTAEKAGPHGYQSDKLLNTFIATFPADDPKYLLLILLDEPQGTKETFNFRTSGWNAAPIVANIIRRVAPMLGVEPDETLEAMDVELLLASN